MRERQPLLLLIFFTLTIFYSTIFAKAIISPLGVSVSSTLTVTSTSTGTTTATVTTTSTSTSTMTVTDTLTLTPSITPTPRVVEITDFKASGPLLTDRGVDLTYELTSYAEQASLSIYSSSMILVWTLDPAPIGSGSHVITWQGLDSLGRWVKNGVYTAVLEIKRADVDIVVSTPLRVKRNRRQF